MIEINGIKQNKLETENRTDAYSTEYNTRISYFLEYAETTGMGNKVHGNVKLPQEFLTRIEDLFIDLNKYYKAKYKHDFRG